MEIDIISNAPITRCYICHKPEVDKICHHCGRAICKTHLSSLVPVETGYENPEFNDLDLDSLINENGIVHCKDCIHFIRSYKWMHPRAKNVGVFGLATALLAIYLNLFWLILIGFFY